MAKFSSGQKKGMLVIISLFSIINAQSAQQPGTWMNVTPSSCVGLFANAIAADPARPSDIYACVDGEGCNKSTDYGLTWTRMNSAGPITGATYLAIDPNPNRDPSTKPVLYVTSIYGQGGIWKSIDGAATWTDIWSNRVYSSDGATNISSDVGGDVHQVFISDKSDPHHLLATLHSYWGTGNNNGVFESTNGGGKWMVNKSGTFNFQPHSDILFPITAATWCVSHGGTMYRTTDGAQSWTAGANIGVVIGRSYCIAGSAIYAGSDYNSGLFKSTDNGATWKKVTTPTGRIAWVGATATKIYAGSGYGWEQPDILSASLGNDASWSSVRVDGMAGNGANNPAITFDGTNYIIVVPNQKAGLWRYVEPAAGTGVISKPAAAAQSTVKKACIAQMMLGNGIHSLKVSTNGKFYDVKGRAAVKAR